MNPFSIFKVTIAATLLITTTLFAQSAPQEKPAFQINRLINSGNSAVGQLSKNLLKTESYQAPYTVEVQYTDTETYQVQVPYTDTETYYENVPHTRSVPYTDYETYYENEYQCQNVTRYRQECHTETECHIVPGRPERPTCQMVEECGINAHGERICKTREVCTGGGQGEPQRVCENKQRCENVPYTDRECGYVQVQRTRQVTRYRDETYYTQELRTRTVTKYRTETRTREVTKTRLEEKCCVTKTRQVFDRQLVYNVTVQFPSNALLIAGENDVLNINLVSANLQTASVSLTPINTIYGYAIAKQQVSGANIYVELALVPKFDMNNAGPNSIQNFKIDFNSALQKFQLSLTDSISSTKIKNVYQANIYDLSTNVLIETVIMNSNGKQALGTLQNNLPRFFKKLKRF